MYLDLDTGHIFEQAAINTYMTMVISPYAGQINNE